MFWFNFILDLNSISLLFLGMVTYMYDNEFEINKNKIYTNYWTTTCMSFTLLRDLSRNPQDSTLELFCSLVWDFKPILPQSSRMFLISSKVSAMLWHIFPHWQRLFYHYRHLIDSDYVRLQSFEKSGTGLICVYHREVMVDYEGVQQKTEFVPQTSAISSVSLCNEYVVCTKINKRIKYL